MCKHTVHIFVVIAYLHGSLEDDTLSAGNEAVVEPKYGSCKDKDQCHNKSKQERFLRKMFVKELLIGIDNDSVSAVAVV